MVLANGTKLGPYEITGALGSGGMGEVYRARDSRLAREIALKVLPQNVCDDIERIHQFEHEARVTATLNHPNIVSIYDVGTDANITYLITELLEGRTLRRQLTEAEVPVRDAINWYSSRNGPRRSAR